MAGITFVACGGRPSMRKVHMGIVHEGPDQPERNDGCFCAYCRPSEVQWLLHSGLPNPLSRWTWASTFSVSEAKLAVLCICICPWWFEVKLCHLRGATPSRMGNPCRIGSQEIEMAANLFLRVPDKIWEKRQISLAPVVNLLEPTRYVPGI